MQSGSETRGLLGKGKTGRKRRKVGVFGNKGDDGIGLVRSVFGWFSFSRLGAMLSFKELEVKIAQKDDQSIQSNLTQYL